MTNNQRENPLLEAALGYTARGIPVFPLHTPRPDGSCSCGKKDCSSVGKHPRTLNGVKDATTDEAQIREWWGMWPDANIGLATGTPSAPISVLDVDCDHSRGKYGDESLRQLESQCGQLPETWICLTGGGGLHYYFYCTDLTLKNSVNLRPGLDIRAAGGYVVAPPSLHASGKRYEWEASNDPEDEPAPALLPDWLYDLISNAGKKPSGQNIQFEAPETVQEGGRNNTMFKLASSLRDKGLTVEEIEAAVSKANELRCNPPLAVGEIKTICQSVGRYERGKLASTESLEPPDYSDAGNSEIFSRTYKDNLIYTDSLGWLNWNGKHWERNEHTPMEFAKSLSHDMLKEAINQLSAALRTEAEAKAKYATTESEEDKKAAEKAKVAVQRAKAYHGHAKMTRNANRLRAMLELSKSALVIKADKLDSNAFDLNTPAGIVNLCTGEIRSHDRGAYCTQITEASPSDHGVDMWNSFLDTVTAGSASIKGFLQLVAGMALIGAVYQEGIILAYGGGRNGKSTLFNALGQAFGTYSGGIDVKILTTDRTNRGASLATLRGKRLVVCGELEEGQRLSVATLKQLASTDLLTIEEKFKQPETIKQSHTLVLFSNHLPRVGSTDGGTWRRLTVVPFTATIPPGGGIQNYADMLVKEAGGAIISWATQGAVNFVKNGFRLDIPDEIAEATEQYQAREDWLSNFVGERCVKDPTARVGAAELYQEYRNWAQGTGDYVRRLSDFTTAMEAAGYQKITPKNKKTWLGLRIDLAQRYVNPYAATV